VVTAADTLVIRRRLPAPREKVFAAWTDPASMARWMSPGGARGATATLDVRVGGQFRITMHGGCDYVHTGEYLVVDPPARLSFTWMSDATDHKPSIVTVELFEAGNETDLVLTHRRLPNAKAVADHTRGWTEIVDKLGEVLS